MILNFLPPQFFAFLLSFTVVVLLIPPLCKLAVSKGFVDRPGGRKTHKVPVPPIGGLIIFGVFIVLSLLRDPQAPAAWPLFSALGLLLISGAVDDHRHINPWIKFFVQIVAAALIVLPGGAQLEHLGNIFGLGILSLGPLSVLFSITCVVLFVNSINLMDGLDGLAGGVSFVALGWLFVAAFNAGVSIVGDPVLLLMGALAGFLVFNMRSPFNKSARLFLGDAGSMSLGLVLAWFCIHLTKNPANVMPPISIAWIIALPIIDVCAQFYRRARDGRHPFSPDRGHFHHLFIDAGYPVGRATLFIILISFILGGVGYMGAMAGVPQVVLTVLWIALILTHMAISEKPARYIRLLNRKLS